MPCKDRDPYGVLVTFQLPGCDAPCSLSVYLAMQVKQDVTRCKCPGKAYKLPLKVCSRVSYRGVYSVPIRLLGTNHFLVTLLDR
jgi:hypothetical protein